MSARSYAVEMYRTRAGKVPFREWLDAIRDPVIVDRIDARLARVREGNLGDYRELKGGIAEFRLFHGPGYRIYFTREGRRLILLLAAGSKATQKRDLRLARAYYEEYKTRRPGGGDRGLP
jgi:putative addiction module killer protein